MYVLCIYNMYVNKMNPLGLYKHVCEEFGSTSEETLNNTSVPTNAEQAQGQWLTLICLRLWVTRTSGRAWGIECKPTIHIAEIECRTKQSRELMISSTIALLLLPEISSPKARAFKTIKPNKHVVTNVWCMPNHKNNREFNKNYQHIFLSTIYKIFL